MWQDKLQLELLHLYARCLRHHGVGYRHPNPVCSPLHLLLLRPWPHRSSQDYRLHEEESNLARTENSNTMDFRIHRTFLLVGHIRNQFKLLPGILFFSILV